MALDFTRVYAHVYSYILLLLAKENSQVICIVFCISIVSVFEYVIVVWDICKCNFHVL